MQPGQSVTTPQEEPGVATGTGSDNGSGRSRPHRPRRPKKEDQDEFLVDVEAPPPLVESGPYDVMVERLERWQFKGAKDAWKITFHCVIFGGPCNETKVPLRMNFDWPVRRASRLWETILVATYPDRPRRLSRISLKRLFVGRVFRAEIRTLISPHRDKNGKPVHDGEGRILERMKSSVVDRFLLALTGTPNDYLL